MSKMDYSNQIRNLVNKSSDFTTSANERGMRVFSNSDFEPVRTVTIDGEIWFVANDVAKNLGYQYPANAIQDNVDDEDKMVVQMADIQDGLPDHMKGSKVSIINRHGALSLIQRSGVASKDMKQRFATSIGFGDEVSLYERKEICFSDALDDFFDAFGLDVTRQYRVGRYRVDFCIPDINLMIEFDESDHVAYDKDNEAVRESFIKNETGFDLVRANDKRSNSYNLGRISAYLLSRCYGERC